MEALEPHLLALLPYIASRFSQGDTALISASEQGHAEAVRILLAAGADVNAKGRVSLHHEFRVLLSAECKR